MTDLKHITETCLMQGVRAAARHVSAVYEAALKPVDLTASQFSTLVALGREQGVTLMVLAERLSMDRTTLIRVLTPMERRSLVRIEASAKDARAKAVYLEEEGRSALDLALPLWSAAQARALASLVQKDVPVLLSSLKTLQNF